MRRTLSEVLSQAEIEALLKSLGGDTVEVANADSADQRPASSAPANFGGETADQVASRLGAKADVQFEVYDFRRPDKFSKDQLRTLQMLHETFARLASSSLSAYLRSAVNIDLISLEQVPYEEYLRSISSSVFTIMSLPPLTGQAALELEFGLAFSMIDRMLGGPGKTYNRNTLTDIERPLVRQAIERMFAALKTAWEGVVIVHPTIEGLETSAQFVQIAPPNDIVVMILFEFRIGSQRGAMSLCIPYLVLKPITTKLSAQKWFASGNRKANPESRRMLGQHVSQAPVDCAVRLGNTRCTIRDFLSLKEGDILRLDQKTAADLTMLIENRPKYGGKPATQGKKLVFSVSNVMED
jgi:flagellar motor switch protein FliM